MKKKKLPGIKRNVSLEKFTTFGIGGKTKYFFIAKDEAGLIRAIKTAKDLKLPFFILGGGSNLLVSDRGFKGLVVKTGKPLASYVSKGLEWAAGIPGTVEGAVFGNAGAFGKSMKEEVQSVKVFDVKTGKTVVFKNKDCKFTYRGSIFKKKKNLIILSVKIKSKKSNPKKIKEYLEMKKEKQPLGCPSAGSIFKNPRKYSAAELIEECGLKGRKIGKAKISEKHANFIVNLGGAKAKDVKSLINLAKKEVKKKFKINLEEEIQIME